MGRGWTSGNKWHVHFPSRQELGDEISRGMILYELSYPESQGDNGQIHVGNPLAARIRRAPRNCGNHGGPISRGKAFRLAYLEGPSGCDLPVRRRTSVQELLAACFAPGQGKKRSVPLDRACLKDFRAGQSPIGRLFRGIPLREDFHLFPGKELGEY
ncbi:hypothetical protein KM043_012783 [Ampulex compressa]|nr:hypothetical protein KM043_012783 [Ampulex compressa]